MFGRLGRFVVHNPWKVIAVWVLAAVGILAFAPSLSDVQTQEQSNFLPDRYESVKALNLADEKFGGTDDGTATIVVKRSDGGQLTGADQGKVDELAQRIRSAGVDRISDVVSGPQFVSPNGKVQLVNAGLQGSPESPEMYDAVERIRQISGQALAGSSLTESVTGDIAMNLDGQDAFEDAFVIVGIATITLIIALLLIIYRSPVAALLPIVTVGIVSAISPGLIAWVAKATGLEADSSLQIILTIVLYGVGTDYILFLLFRYRERLRAGEPSKQALVSAVHRVGEVIASAAGAIVIAFMALLLATFGVFTTLGPALAIAVVVMALAAVTLVPAVVSLIGTKVFWPSRSWQRVPRGSVFQRLGRFTGRRPGVVALVSGGLMVLLALGAFGMKADFGEFAAAPKGTESAQGFDDLQSGFPAGALNPTQVFLRSDNGQQLDHAAVDQFASDMKQAPGVSGIRAAGSDSAAAYSKDGTVAQLDLLLKDSPYSNAALDLAGGQLREVAHAQAPSGTTALVGGPSSIFADIQDANSRDLRVIFPVAAVLTAFILALLLRALVAPVYLMIAVVLGFFSTLGATVLAFQGVGDRPGLSFMLPTILYLFVVAIGTDYNILMIARLREEARSGHDPRTAADQAVAHGGPSVGSAGLILAGTFASMMLGGIAFLVEMGFAVSLGITIAAFVMSMFLVPSLTALLGHRAWWPGHGDRAGGGAAEATEREAVAATAR